MTALDKPRFAIQVNPYKPGVCSDLWDILSHMRRPCSVPEIMACLEDYEPRRSEVVVRNALSAMIRERGDKAIDRYARGLYGLMGQTLDPLQLADPLMRYLASGKKGFEVISVSTAVWWAQTKRKWPLAPEEALRLLEHLEQRGSLWRINDVTFAPTPPTLEDLLA